MRDTLTESGFFWAKLIQQGMKVTDRYIFHMGTSSMNETAQFIKGKTIHVTVHKIVGIEHFMLCAAIFVSKCSKSSLGMGV